MPELYGVLASVGSMVRLRIRLGGAFAEVHGAELGEDENSEKRSRSALRTEYKHVHTTCSSQRSPLPRFSFNPTVLLAWPWPAAVDLDNNQDINKKPPSNTKGQSSTPPCKDLGFPWQRSESWVYSTVTTMRLLTLVCLSGLVNSSLALAPRNIAAHQFGVTGETSALDDFGLLKGLAGNLHTQTSSATTIPSSTSNDDKKAGTSSGSITIPTDTSYSVTGTVPPVPYAIQSSHSTPPASSTPSQSSTTSSSSTQQPSNSTASSSTSEWKIIGVAVIAFSAVAAILLLAVFFDQWWRFIRDLVWRRRNKQVEEELVPDWEKARWELRLAKDPELARYPSFASLPSSLPSVPVVPILQREPSMVTSQGTTPLPPQSQVPLGRSASRRDAQARALERGIGEQQEQRLARRASVSRRQHPETRAGVGGVGLGLGRVESVKTLKREERAYAGATSPRVLPPGGRTGGATNEDPFCDPHPAACMPEDVYGGIE